jgi:hypothetical protein
MGAGVEVLAVLAVAGADGWERAATAAEEREQPAVRATSATPITHTARRIGSPSVVGRAAPPRAYRVSRHRWRLPERRCAPRSGLACPVDRQYLGFLVAVLLLASRQVSSFSPSRSCCLGEFLSAIHPGCDDSMYARAKCR